MKKSDWDKIKIDSLKEHIMVYQTSRNKFSGHHPADYVELKIPKYSMKFGDYLETSETSKYHYKRIKEIREI